MRAAWRLARADAAAHRPLRFGLLAEWQKVVLGRTRRPGARRTVEIFSSMPIDETPAGVTVTANDFFLSGVTGTARDVERLPSVDVV
jgi:hypothetical protein